MNRLLIGFGLFLSLGALAFFLFMTSQDFGSTTDRAELMQRVGVVSGGVGAAGLVVLVVGLLRMRKAG